MRYTNHCTEDEELVSGVKAWSPSLPREGMRCLGRAFAHPTARSVVGLLDRPAHPKDLAAARHLPRVNVPKQLRQSLPATRKTRWQRALGAARSWLTPAVVDLLDAARL
jgi:hypothetical protein